MKMLRQVIVFDAADLEAESAFWAGVLGGNVFKVASRLGPREPGAEDLRREPPTCRTGSTR